MNNEYLTIKKHLIKISKCNTEKQFNNAFLDLRLYACSRLAKRYNLGDKINDGLALECIEVLKSKNTKHGQKEAARQLLNLKYGSDKVNKIIEDFAIVNDRGDSLVNRWTKKVLKRDNYTCKLCGGKDNLNVHHIIKWSDDPINRINIDNGITLCSKCHALQHPEIESFILSRS